MTNRTIAQLFDLTGQVAIVTGAGQGIGRAIALRLAEAGAAVLLVDVDQEAAELVASQLAGHGGLAATLCADVAQVSAARALAQQAAQTFGRLDILINNAGIYPFAAALRVSEEHWDRVTGVNLKGTFFCAQAAAQQMVAEGHGGRIVNLASVDALRPTGNLAPYDAAKGGVLALTGALACEFAQYSITVNALVPGEIATPGAQAAATTLSQEGGVHVEPMDSSAFLARIPLGRLGEPDDVAWVALFLVSGAAEYMTGSCVVVDGGYLLT
jgi:2-dehydro-3-deoxy-D-gluconate 5-dehydrogenase